MSIPNNLKYTKEHEWIDVKDGIGTIGITNFAQSELGDIVFVELPNIGDEIAQNDVFGTIEAVKTLADLFSPVTGEIIEINDELENSPEMINSNCYKDGWIVKIKLSNESELSNLLSDIDYKELID